ncbi:hypothetical protein COW99_04675 [Candidatus Roizmanbacteria bacterium CG22_combo_CG10-13_8_21_14_all_38_20]|uniref:Methyltransferase domain-containing protein n=1 Tax=Candidatus Roizmanbacteria bacterium CG22_combo_CG10-13_8_21_14_all_38_20 TaxID=1974862 RepID=A0A2H0BUR0_9BACT|nr:class I SAM-dependent methyltransferase [Candidatus Microgenomates bacterium]PIP61279.1 MAG: hypothetical protein COW99_04675 [Candidatus Roizmanbacteria bacterium CG22_combo_CG10-13_8_21_14_all_38_20]PJC31073.1 MAG: hypothetical protein CO050_04400 [Candidatus Roizmanbacteria bacterium CG_4_9_14_0_2_um_filter_38_17]
MTSNFYNKVARKFGNYHTDARYTQEYPDNNPEEVFKEKLLSVSGKDKLALDLGCADGRFTLSVAKNFSYITAIDTSSGMLDAARKLQKEKGIANVTFEEQDAFKTTFDHSSFDVIWSRRGPTPYVESFRLLKPGGYFIEIDIGEKDCQRIKEVFDRGQGYGKWKNSRLKQIQKQATDIGFTVSYAKDFLYNEYYKSYNDLDLFLQGVPIFEDFDSEKDKEYLTSFVKQNSIDKGIRMERHRVVTVLQKY